MNAPVEKLVQASKTGAESNSAPSTAAQDNDNWIKNFDILGFAKSFSIGALLISFAGWLIHGYGIPAASSIWQEMIRPRVDNFIIDGIQRSPRIHDFMVTEINNYLSGNIPSVEKPNEMGAKLRTLANSSDTIETI